MNDTPSLTPSGRLAFLRRRPFWAVFLGLQVAASLILCSQILGADFTSAWFYEAIAGFMGASFLGLFVEILVDNETIAQILTLSLFLTFYLVFLYQTFRKSFVHTQYPILLTTLWLLSTSYLVSLL